MNSIFLIMHKQKMTQVQLAGLMGKHPPFINQLLKRPNLDNTRYGTLKEVAGHLGVEVADLERPVKVTE